MTSLNAARRHRILSTFSHVDDLLQGVDRLAQVRPSAFSREQPDLSETETHLVLSLVETARSRMLKTLDCLGLTRPGPTLSARWSIETALRFMDIALPELTPQTLKGYGAVDAQSVADVAAVASAPRDVITARARRGATADPRCRRALGRRYDRHRHLRALPLRKIVANQRAGRRSPPAHGCDARDVPVQWNSANHGRVTSRNIGHRAVGERVCSRWSYRDRAVAWRRPRCRGGGVERHHECLAGRQR